VKTVVFYINSASVNQLIVSIQPISIDAVVEVIISCLVLCFLLRYIDVSSSRNGRQRMRMLVVVRRAESPEADRQQGALRRQLIGVTSTMSDSTNHIELAAEIVSAYVSNNSVPSSELPSLLSDVHAALVRVATGAQPVVVEAAKPAVPPKKSITSDYIICLEDGRKFKSLKRHLRTQYNLSPEEYREKWGLASDYPMVAPAYAKARSALAKQMGLGQQRRRRK
jgi:predicted transcriptional regulator